MSAWLVAKTPQQNHTWMKEKRRERMSLASDLAPSSSARNNSAKPIKRRTRRLRRRFVGPFPSFSIPCASPVFSPSHCDFPRARSLPRRFPFRAKSSPPGAKSSPPGAKSSSFSDDLSSPQTLFYDFRNPSLGIRCLTGRGERWRRRLSPFQVPLRPSPCRPRHHQGPPGLGVSLRHQLP